MMIYLEKQKYLIAVLKKDPLELLNLFRTALSTFKFRYIIRCVGKGTIVRENTRMINAANIKIGEGCLIRDSAYLRAGTQGKILVGNGCGLNSFCRLFGHGGIEIQDDTFCGPGTTITTTAHDLGAQLERTHFLKVTLEKDVWVGANVTILPGVTIGHGSVIGAASVVTKDIPPNSLAVGNPAKVIKKSIQVGERTKEWKSLEKVSASSL
jgi:acetyltransferase-like isoleucine patch superfamily enzyme